MKNLLPIVAFILCAVAANAQTKTHKYGITAGGSIQHYNGNLGNTFFKFKSTCFGGFTTTLGVYLNRSFDFNIGGYIGNFGYHQEDHSKDKEVALAHRCPGCADRLGMGELRSLMVSGNIALKYKLANGILLKEDAKLAPYLYGGVGLNHLSDNMGRQCVNVGYHFTVNAGAGLKYNITPRLNIAYNLGMGCFMTKKVYATNEITSDTGSTDAELQKWERRKDLYMQNSLSLGFNF